MDTIFFWASKIVWMVITPGSLIMLLAVGGWLCLAFNWQRAGRRLVSLAALLLVLIAFLPMGEWLIAPLENRFETNPTLPAQIDGIIVLGGAINPYYTELWEQPQIGGAAERLTAFIDLGNRYPNAKLLFTGGSGSLLRQDFKEADVVDQVFYQLGYVNHRVQFESQSRNTYENAQYSKEMLQPKPGETWLLVTSAFHMPRSVGVFCGQGWPVIPYPVDHIHRRNQLWRVELSVTGHLSDLETAIREWVGLVAYRVTGRTSDLLPSLTSCESE